MYLYYLANHWHHLSNRDRKLFAEWACDDAVVFVETYADQPAGLLILIQAKIYLGCAYGDQEVLQRERQSMDWLLGDEEFVDSLSAHELAFAYNLQAQCYHFLGELGKAEAGFDQSIKLEPSDRRWYLNRAQFWDRRGRSELAEYDRGMARALTGGGTFPRKPRRDLPPLPSATDSPFDVSR